MSRVSLFERRTRVTRKMKTVNAAFSKSVSCTYIMFIGIEGERVCVHHYMHCHTYVHACFSFCAMMSSYVKCTSRGLNSTLQPVVELIGGLSLTLFQNVESKC